MWLPVKSMRLRIVLFVAVSAFLLAVYMLDRGGVFIAFSYLPAYLLGAVLLGGLVILFGVKRSGSGDTYAFLSAGGMALVGLLLCPYLSTSPRKDFFLAYKRIMPGMAVAKVRKIMGPYGPERFDPKERELTFRFQSGKGTVDVVHVNLSNNLAAVLSAEFSPD